MTLETSMMYEGAADMRWRESRPEEADNIDVGPVSMSAVGILAFR
jgi:hypothetical protein